MDQPDQTNKLGDVYTLDEAAAKLRVSRNFLSLWIKGTSFYSKAGRVYRFSDADILSIWESMRCASDPMESPRLRIRSALRTARLSNSSNLQKLLSRKPRKLSP